MRNWLFGWYIVEYEQKGADRANYGAQLIPNLAKKLKGQIKGSSFTNLNLCRQFYQSYPKMIQTPPEQLPPLTRPEPDKNDQSMAMSPTLSSESDGAIMSNDTIQTLSEQLTARLQLSWSHYVFLAKIENSEEQSFYEIESINAGWSIRELERQFNSGLYERLALSRDKGGIPRNSFSPMQSRWPVAPLWIYRLFLFGYFPRPKVDIKMGESQDLNAGTTEAPCAEELKRPIAQGPRRFISEFYNAGVSRP